MSICGFCDERFNGYRSVGYYFLVVLGVSCKNRKEEDGDRKDCGCCFDLGVLVDIDFGLCEGNEG
jgi:hypothetical protein